jgi:hypothetical protein
MDQIVFQERTEQVDSACSEILHQTLSTALSNFSQVLRLHPLFARLLRQAPSPCFYIFPEGLFFLSFHLSHRQSRGLARFDRKLVCLDYTLILHVLQDSASTALTRLVRLPYGLHYPDHVAYLLADEVRAQDN